MPARSLGRRLSALVLTAAFASVAAVPWSAWAAPSGGDPIDAQVEVENAKNTFPGIVNANAVYVRCGPAESYYPTLKLDKGARVMVVGMKLDWLKVVPPEGSFCYISKAFVDRNGDGTAGKVNKDGVNVRAGSTLNSLKVVPLCQLSVGMDVKILGEQDEYYKIEPPAGKAFVYLSKQFVDPDPNAKPVPLPKEENPGLVKNDNGNGGAKPEQAVKVKAPDVAKAEVAEGGGAAKEQATGDVATQPGGDNAVAGGATTKPADDAALVEAGFDKAEAQYLALGNKLDAKAIDELIKQYETLSATEKLPSTLQRIADNRVATLKIRSTSAAEVAHAQEAQEQMRKKQVALQAERKELEEQLAQKSVAVYTAVGELQASSLQLGAKTLYRLTDPANGRTVVYLRSDDGKVITMMGKFIGVKGELATEPQLSLKVITITAFDAVEPSKLGRGVTATVIPPSMVSPDDASTAAHLDARP